MVVKCFMKTFMGKDAYQVSYANFKQAKVAHIVENIEYNHMQKIL